jgi:hypothetical protein
MSACVGIDVHRNRSQVAVTGEGGKVLVNRNLDRMMLGLHQHMQTQHRLHRWRVREPHEFRAGRGDPESDGHGDIIAADRVSVGIVASGPTSGEPQ